MPDRLLLRLTGRAERRPVAAPCGPCAAMARSVVFFLLFTGAFLVGRLTRIEGSDVALVWPAAGISVLWLMVSRRNRVWQRINAALLVLTTVSLNLATGLGAGAAVGCAVANLVQAIVVTRLFLWGTGGHPRLERPRDLGMLVVSAVVGASANLVLAALTFWAAAGAPDPGWSAGWFIRSATSVVVIVAFGLSLRGLHHRPPMPAPAGPVEATAFVATAVVLLGVTFVTGAGTPTAWLLLPLGIWSGLRFSTRSAAWAAMALTCVVITATLLRCGPFNGADPLVDALAAQGFTVVLTVFTLALASHRDERDRFQQANENSRAEAWALSRAAEAARDHYAQVLDAVEAQAIIATDLDGRITVFNPGAERMLGFSEAEMLGRPPTVLHLGEEILLRGMELGIEPGFPVLIHAAVEGRAEERRWTYVRRDRVRLQVLLTVTAIRDGDGEISGYLGVATDVSEQHRTQLALANALVREHEAVQRLQDVDQLKTEFVSTVSHELRTPVTSVVGYVELLRDGLAGDLQTEQYRLLGVVDRNARRLLTLVEDLLTLSRLESRAQRIDQGAVDLARVVREAVSSVEPLHAARDLAFDLRLPDDDLPLLGDATQLERVVVNLLSNAIKFTPDGGRITVVLEREGSLAQLTVRDTGIGIPEAEQGQLFTRFFRSSRARAEAIPGSGLGLSIVAGLVEAHGGTVEARSGPEEGTSFTVRLPLADTREGPEVIDAHSAAV